MVGRQELGFLPRRYVELRLAIHQTERDPRFPEGDPLRDLLRKMAVYDVPAPIDERTVDDLIHHTTDPPMLIVHGTSPQLSVDTKTASEPE